MTTPIGSSDGEREALPPLPKPVEPGIAAWCQSWSFYTAEQMQEYARAALSSDREMAPTLGQAPRDIWEVGGERASLYAAIYALKPKRDYKHQHLHAAFCAGYERAVEDAAALVMAPREMAPEAKANLERDAARYQWLRDRFMGADFDWGHHIDEAGEQHSACVLLIQIADDAKVYGALDPTVDAALASSAHIAQRSEG